MSPRVTTTIADTALHENLRVFAVDIETDTVFSAIEGSLIGYSGVTYAAGRTLYFHATKITLASGSVTIYEL